MYLTGIIIAAATAWLLRSFSTRNQNRNYTVIMTVLGILLLVSEAIKQYLLTAEVYGHYNVWYFPFQLCSVPLYLCPVMLLLRDRGRHAVQVFLMDFTLLGGIAAFLDTSGMHYSMQILTVHSFLWHYVLVFIGVLSGLVLCSRGAASGTASDSGAASISGAAFASGFSSASPSVPSFRRLIAGHMREFLSCLPIWGVCLVVATLLNTFLWQFGEISMFYISPYEPSGQIIIHDIAMNYGILAGNLCYLFAMLLAAFLIHLMWGIVRYLFAIHSSAVRG